MLKGLFGKVLKCKKQDKQEKGRKQRTGKKKKMKNMRFRRGVLSFTLSFFLQIANEDKNRMGDIPTPSLQKNVPEEYLGNCV